MQLFTLLQMYNGISIDISNGDRQCLVKSFTIEKLPCVGHLTLLSTRELKLRGISVTSCVRGESCNLWYLRNLQLA